MEPTQIAPPKLNDTAWTLDQPAGGTPADGTWPTLRFEGGRISGSDGCNRYNAPYTGADGSLQFGLRIGTQMACPDDAMLRARAFADTLARTRAYRIDAGRLVLLDASGAPLARFDAHPTGLAGTSWKVGAYNNGKQAVVGVLGGTQLTLEFLAEGKVHGSAGCNNFSGSYRADGRRLELGPLAATRKACAQPEGTMAQEAAFLRALESVDTGRREGDRLELRTAADALAATMTLAPPARP